MNNIIRVKIEHVRHQENYSTPKETFWTPFQNAFRKSREENEDKERSYRSIESFESSLEKNFGNELSRSLIRYFRKGLDNIDRNYYDEFYRRQYHKGNYPEDFRNTLYQNDATYRDALNKSILASQILIKTIDISYGTLKLGIIIEPIDKFLDIFDNNFDLIRLFFESYVPPAFIQSIETIGHTSYWGLYNDLQLTYNYEFPENLKRNQQQNQLFLNKPTTIDESQSNKIDRTKWMTGLVTSPMLLPFILALLILYYYTQKLDSSNASFLEQSNSILQQKEDVIKAYKELIEQYKSDAKRDTIIIKQTK